MTPPQSKLSKRTLAIALLVAGALFMENLDGTILATGLPAMARTFGTEVVDVNVGVTAYLLALAVFIPISGWMADRFGPRRVFTSAIAVFTLASAWCAAAHSLPEFTAARVVQGIGGSMMVPVGRLMTVRSVPKDQIMRTVAYTIWPSLVAPILGPVLGGWITTYFDWRWMFLLNLPVGLVLLVASFVLVKDSERVTTAPFDWAGFVLLGVTCFSTIDLMESASVQPTRWWRLGLMAALAVVGGALSLRHFRRARQPLFDLSTLKIPTYRAVLLGGSWSTTAVFMTPFLLPIMFQLGFGLSAFKSGSLVVAVFAGNLAMKAVTNSLLRRYGFRTVLMVNTVATAVALGACALLTAGTARWIVLLVLFLGGLGRSMQLTAYTTLSFADMSDLQMSSASAMLAMARQLTTSVGVGFAAVLLRIAGWAYGEPGALHLPEFHAAFVVVGMLALLSLPSAIGLAPDAGAQVSGNQPLAKLREPETVDA